MCKKAHDLARIRSTRKGVSTCMHRMRTELTCCWGSTEGARPSTRPREPEKTPNGSWSRSTLRVLLTPQHVEAYDPERRSAQYAASPRKEGLLARKGRG